jgi:hypothetical protein
MPRDYRTMFDKDFIGAWDLFDKAGKAVDAVVTITSIKVEEIVGEGGRKDNCPVMRMQGKKKGFILNVTNCRSIAGMYGNDVDGWVGKRITLYPTTTQFGRNTVDCIRVRTNVPGGSPNDPPVTDDPEGPDGTASGNEGLAGKL